MSNEQTIPEDGLTEWFLKGIKPIHVGTYEVENIAGTDARFYCYWNGLKWGWCAYSPEAAFERAAKTNFFASSAARQNHKWRGVREDWK